MVTGVVEVYATGWFWVTVCAPADMPVQEVIHRVSILRSSKSPAGWKYFDDDTFKDGKANPCSCNKHQGRQHWLLKAV